MFLPDIDMLAMVEKGIRGEMCHSIYQYAKAKNKYMKDYDNNKESSYRQHWYVNNLYGWAMSQKSSVNNFEWVKDISKFNEDFLKKTIMKDIFLNLMLNITNKSKRKTKSFNQ